MILASQSISIYSEVFCEKSFLKSLQNLKKNTLQNLQKNTFCTDKKSCKVKVIYNFVKKRTVPQVCSCTLTKLLWTLMEDMQTAVCHSYKQLVSVVYTCLKSAIKKLKQCPWPFLSGIFTTLQSICDVASFRKQLLPKRLWLFFWEKKKFPS